MSDSTKITITIVTSLFFLISSILVMLEKVTVFEVFILVLGMFAFYVFVTIAFLGVTGAILNLVKRISDL